MKISDLRKHLNSLAAALNAVGAKESADALKAMSDGFAPFNTRDVTELELLGLQSSSEVGDRPQVREVHFVLLSFEEFITRAAKPPARAAFNSLRIFLNDRQDMAIRAFFGALHEAFSPDRPKPVGDQTVVDAYVGALRDAKHDDEKFPRLFSQLSSDERVTKDDVVEIANQFAFKMARSTSKKTALDRIWKMHNASETFAAKSRAMKGKSAA